MWSSGFIGGRLGTESATTLSLMSWRSLLLVPLIALALIHQHRSGAGLSPASWPLQLIVGLLSQVVLLSTVIGGIELGVSPGTSAIVLALQPLAVGALAGPLLGERVSRREWIGLTVGFAGVLVAVGGDVARGSAPPWAYLLPFVGMVSLVAATFLEARATTHLPVAEALSVQCATGSVVFTAVAVGLGQFTGPHLADPRFWAAVSWFIVFGTLGGYGFYWLVLRHSGPTRVSSLLYLTPPVTAIWAWLMFGDPVSRAGLAGLAICGLGVATVFVRPRTRKLQAAPAQQL
jgi:drug/metabolite transporter (DMT)-like permease